MNEEARQLALFAPPAPADPVAEVEPSTGQTASSETSPSQTSTEVVPRLADGVLDLRRQLDQRVTPIVTSVVLTRNRSRIVSAKQLGQGLEVRIHHCFVDADHAVLDAVARLLVRTPRGDVDRREALEVVREHFRAHARSAETSAETTAAPARRRRRLRPVGEHHDLRALRDRVNREYFDGRVEVEITWGRDAPRRRRGRAISLRLGSYAELDRLVRIHPVLDRADVPEYVVESVVHHEMLHAVVPIERGRGRRRVHTREFRRREHEHRHFERAQRWIADNLERLARLR